jgi:hypothetical protein
MGDPRLHPLCFHWLAHSLWEQGSAGQTDMYLPYLTVTQHLSVITEVKIILRNLIWLYSDTADPERENFVAFSCHERFKSYIIHRAFLSSKCSNSSSSSNDNVDDDDHTRVYSKATGLAAWSENCKLYSSLSLGAVVSSFCESVSWIFPP